MSKCSPAFSERITRKNAGIERRASDLKERAATFTMYLHLISAPAYPHNVVTHKTQNEQKNGKKLRLGVKKHRKSNFPQIAVA